MQEYQGVLKELGQSSHIGSPIGDANIKTYTYVEIGGETLKKIKTYPGIDGKLRLALEYPEPVTLYVEGGYLCGMRTGDGRLFATEGRGFFPDLLQTLSMAFLCLLTSLLIIGLLFMPYMIWFFSRHWAFRRAARSLPGAVFV